VGILILSLSVVFISGKTTMVLDIPSLLILAPAYPLDVVAFTGPIKLIDFLGCKTLVLYNKKKIQ
jgi:hypothetical protein